jgi:hypothetical protein
MNMEFGSVPFYLSLFLSTRSEYFPHFYLLCFWLCFTLPQRTFHLPGLHAETPCVVSFTFQF